MIAPYVMRIGKATLWAAGAFILAWILVLYMLIERDETYAWIRGFVPSRLRARFDRTAAEARDVASGFVISNFVTSVCAGIYFFTWLTVLGVPGALLLAVLAFVFDFIPVLGFYLSCAPAMAMAATQSSTLALAMIPIYLSVRFHRELPDRAARVWQPAPAQQAGGARLLRGRRTARRRDRRPARASARGDLPDHREALAAADAR